MSDNIDYDELDKAVTQAIKANSPKKVASAKPAAKSSVTVKTTPKAAPAPAHRYMDFVATPRKHSVSTPKTVVKTTTPSPAPSLAPKPRRVAKITTTNSVMPKYRPAASLRAAQDAAKKAATTKPVAAAKPAVKPVAKPVAKPAPKVAAKKVEEKPAAQPVRHNPVPRGSATADPANLPGAVQPRKPAAKRADAAENYSLGGKTPFIDGAKVEKRPLGKNVPDSAKDLESTKNTYSTKNPLKKRHNDRHTVVEDDKKHSGWLWTILVLIIIAAGGGLGYLAYLIVFAN